MKKMYCVYAPGEEERINKKATRKLLEAIQNQAPLTDGDKKFLELLQDTDNEIRKAVQLPEELLESIKHPCTRNDCNKIKRWFIELRWKITWKYLRHDLETRIWFRKKKNWYKLRLMDWFQN